MLTLYRTVDSPLADEVEDVLRDLVIAYRVATVGDEEADQSGELPALRDGSEWISGRERLMERLQEWARLMADWDRYTSDACFLEKDGTIC